MTPLIFYLVIGALLLVLLLRALLRRPSRAEGSAEALLEARHALRTLQLGLLPPELVDRFFARDDLQYVAANATMKTEYLFLEERKRIVLAWIMQVRQQIINLQHFHFGQLRNFVHVSLASEIALAWEFASLRVVTPSRFRISFSCSPGRTDE